MRDAGCIRQIFPLGKFAASRIRHPALRIHASRIAHSASRMTPGARERTFVDDRRAAHAPLAWRRPVVLREWPGRVAHKPGTTELNADLLFRQERLRLAVPARIHERLTRVRTRVRPEGMAREG